MSSNHDRERPGSAGPDAPVIRAWRQVSDEQPPPQLDARIVAAAHRAVSEEGADVASIHAGRRSLQRLMRWQPLAAAATVAGLALVLLQLLPRERDVAPSIRMQEQAPATASVLEKSRSPAAREADDASAAAAAAGSVAGASAEAAGRTDRATSIAALLASGDSAGAADELRAFRAADPDADAYLPESLRAWARTVK